VRHPDSGRGTSVRPAAHPGLVKLVALVILGLVVVWLFGGLLLRLGGLFLMVVMVFALVSGADHGLHAGTTYAVLWLAAGALMWLAGHWHFAFRRGQPKSALADELFCRLPAGLDPLRRYRVPQAGAGYRPAAPLPDVAIGGREGAGLRIPDSERSPEPSDTAQLSSIERGRARYDSSASAPRPPLMP
jgi:hypothetical protein